MLFTSIAKLTPEVRRTDVIGSLFRAPGTRRGLGHADVFRVVLFVDRMFLTFRVWSPSLRLQTLSSSC